MNVVLLLLTFVCAQYSPTNSTWNYALNGTDWTIAPNCVKNTTLSSPITIRNFNTTVSTKAYTTQYWS